MKVQMVDPRRLNPSPWNPREISPEEMDKLRASIREHGMVENIVVQMPGDRIIGGHQRVAAAILEGLTEVPVYRVQLSDEEAKVLSLRLNKIAGRWDGDKLRELLDQIEKADLARTGFDRDELEGIFEKGREKAAIEKMEVRPAPEVVWYLLAIPLTRFAEVQEHVAALEKAADLSVQSSGDKTAA